MSVDIKSKTAEQAYHEIRQCLVAGRTAHLIDVRTQAEWVYVGIPNVPILKTIWWVRFPDGMQNPRFVDDVYDAGVEKDHSVYLICRSGVRSLSAAQLLRSHGFIDLTNVSDGFEGDPNHLGHRNSQNGWRHANLPWRQS